MIYSPVIFTSYMHREWTKRTRFCHNLPGTPKRFGIVDGSADAGTKFFFSIRQTSHSPNAFFEIPSTCNSPLLNGLQFKLIYRIPYIYTPFFGGQRTISHPGAKYGEWKVASGKNGRGPGGELMSTCSRLKASNWALRASAVSSYGFDVSTYRNPAAAAAEYLEKQLIKFYSCHF